MQRLLLASLLAVLAGAALAQTTFTIGPNDVATGTIPTMETTHAYLLDVGPRVERLVIAVDGEGQDADLAVYLGDDEVFYDASSAQTATYDVRDPSAGRYRIEVLNLLFQELSYTLTTSTRTSGTTGGAPATPTPPATTPADRGEIALGGQRESLASGSGTWQTYVLRVPNDTRGFAVHVDAGGRDVDLAVRFRDLEIFRDVSTNPYPQFRLPDPAAGTYLLSVRSPTGRDAPYRIRVDASGATATTPRPVPPPEPSTPPTDATHDDYPTAAATCRTRAEDGVFGDLREGERIVVTCPAGCSDGLTIWGDGIYTDDSAICRAAIHAGRVPGNHPFSVLLTILPGQARYEGVDRHGIESRSYGRWPRSFAFGLGPFGEDEAR
jgi:hypothetical protein